VEVFRNRSSRCRKVTRYIARLNALARRSLFSSQAGDFPRREIRIIYTRAAREISARRAVVFWMTRLIRHRNAMSQYGYRYYVGRFQVVRVLSDVSSFVHESARARDCIFDKYAFASVAIPLARVRVHAPRTRAAAGAAITSPRERSCQMPGIYSRGALVFASSPLRGLLRGARDTVKPCALSYFVRECPRVREMEQERGELRHERAFWEHFFFYASLHYART